MAMESCKNYLRFSLEAAFGDRVEPGEKLSDNDLRNLFYGNYMEPDAEPKYYDECESYEKLEKLMKYYLGDYNAFSSSPMDLVMFRFAIEHVSRYLKLSLCSVFLNQTNEYFLFQSIPCAANATW